VINASTALVNSIQPFVLFVKKLELKFFWTMYFAAVGAVSGLNVF